MRFIASAGLHPLLSPFHAPRAAAARLAHLERRLTVTFLLGMILLNAALIYWFEIEDGTTQVIVCLATTITAAALL